MRVTTDQVRQLLTRMAATNDTYAVMDRHGFRVRVSLGDLCQDLIDVRSELMATDG